MLSLLNLLFSSLSNFLKTQYKTSKKVFCFSIFEMIFLITSSNNLKSGGKIDIVPEDHEQLKLAINSYQHLYHWYRNTDLIAFEQISGTASRSIADAPFFSRQIASSTRLSKLFKLLPCTL